jgi:hypothetical protein
MVHVQRYQNGNSTYKNNTPHKYYLPYVYVSVAYMLNCVREEVRGEEARRPFAPEVLHILISPFFLYVSVFLCLCFYLATQDLC